MQTIPDNINIKGMDKPMNDKNIVASHISGKSQTQYPTTTGCNGIGGELVTTYQEAKRKKRRKRLYTINRRSKRDVNTNGFFTFFEER